MPETTERLRSGSGWIARQVGNAQLGAKAPGTDNATRPAAPADDNPSPAPPVSAAVEATRAEPHAGEDPATAPSDASSDTSDPRRAKTSRRRGAPTTRSTAPALGERQAPGRFQVRLTPTLASVVADCERKLHERTGLSQNELRQIAVWAILGDSDDAAIEAFVRDVLPDWHQARLLATQQQETATRARRGAAASNSSEAKGSDSSS